MMPANPGPWIERLEAVLHSPHTPERRGVLPHDLAEWISGERVEGLPLRCRPQQSVLVGLPVHGDELVGDLGQQRGRHRGAAREGAGPTL